jgi:glucose uptake protein GlcU
VGDREVNPGYIFGLIYAMFCAVFFGLYAVPRKYSKMGKYTFLLSMCIGVGVSTYALGALGEPGLSLNMEQVILSLLSGCIWTIGTFTFILSIDAIGIVKATPIKNLTGVMGAISGIVVFDEFTANQPLHIAYILGGSIFIAISAVVISRLYPEKEKILEGDRLDDRTAVIRGMILALIAAVSYSLYTAPGKMVYEGNGALMYLYIRYMGIGTALSSLIGFLVFDRDFRTWFKEPLKEHLIAALGGLIWAIAYFLVTLGIEAVGLAVAWPLGNLNTIVSVAYGVLVLREVNVKGQSLRIISGLALAVLGVWLIVLARM